MGVTAIGLPQWSVVERLMRGSRKVTCICRAPVEGVLNQSAAF
jgi:hypothetical protein